MIGRESLKGYLLEEILAYLIRNTGYNLLVDPSQDQRELDKRGNGLVVKGRGADHQVDVLGQLKWVPAFTFPLRLFVEAKCRSVRTGIGEIRNAVGVLDDINQNYSPVREGKGILPRYTYRYALFSTSGFTSTAADMALAHQISLVDLSGTDFLDLRDLLDNLANWILTQLRVTSLSNNSESDEDSDSNEPEENIRGRESHNLIRLLRMHIRTVLGTWPLGQALVERENDYLYSRIPNLAEFNDLITNQMERFGEFFVGMSNGPFLLLLRSHNPKSFLRYCDENPVHKVSITWTRQDGLERQWNIKPLTNPETYSLSFGLPKSIGDWIFDNESLTVERALNVKEQFMSNITIYRFDQERDIIIRLLFNIRDIDNIDGLWA
ncbi:hypothetical protein ACPUYX_11110 [Desulfosporosinus sp. SYSU MS00001]|uniref:hypothetical protein n=1 Tax=Desulfosporosinus sp. SYSU MS00001 TaxID=3416284 RepID=UPI003CEF1B67